MNEAIGAAVLERIATLWRRRAWYASHLGWIVQSKVDDDRELRALVRLARAARRAQQRDRQPLGIPYHDWQAGRLSEPSLIAGYGGWPEADSDAFDRESQPEFNGAFNRW